MEKIIAGRHQELEDDVKEFVMNELRQLEGTFKKLTSARVVLDLQKHVHSVEIIIHGKNIDIESKASDRDRTAAIHAAFDKTERQLRKHIDKIQEHNHHGFRPPHRDFAPSEPDTDIDVPA